MDSDALRIVAIVPMRHSSERTPGKNYRSFAGRPLFHHIIGTLLGCPEIGEVVIDTDSALIREDARDQFPGVRVVERPSYLSAGEIPMNDVLLHTVSQVEADLYLQTHSTNPLLLPSTISRAIRVFLDGQPANDSLFSVKRIQARFWNDMGQSINHDPLKLMRTQDLAPVFEENSCIYLFSRKSLEAYGNRIGNKPMLFEMDPVESWDIDEEFDFQIAELLFLHRDKLKKSLP